MTSLFAASPSRQRLGLVPKLEPKTAHKTSDQSRPPSGTFVTRTLKCSAALAATGPRTYRLGAFGGQVTKSASDFVETNFSFGFPSHVSTLEVLPTSSLALHTFVDAASSVHASSRSVKPPPNLLSPLDARIVLGIRQCQYRNLVALPVF